MIKKALLFLLVFTALGASAQVVVNKKDINQEVKSFELYAFKKPFSTKESYFINYGQENFKIHYYDHKRQAVFNAEGEKFSKGSWLKLVEYLEAQGWEKTEERLENIGNNQGRVITFKRSK